MKTVFAPCAPDEDVEMGNTSAWMRIELPGLALSELHQLVSYFHAAPQEIVQITARLSMVVTVFDDPDRAGHTTVCAGFHCGVLATQVRPKIEPPWVLIESDQVYFGIQVEHPDYGTDAPFDMISVNIPYADLGLEVTDVPVLETR
jgi:hypothetical protein